MLCPLCKIDVSISQEGRLSRHKVMIFPYQAKVWCMYGGTAPTEPLQDVPDWRTLS